MAGAGDLMLLTPKSRPFTANGWRFEQKYDGFRALAVVGPAGTGPQLISRGGRALTPFFPEIERALVDLPRGVFDAELVVTGADGRPTFSRIQSRHRLTRRGYAEAAARSDPATLCVFDVLWAGETDLRARPLHERLAWLEEHVQPPAGVLLVPGIEGHGEALFAEAVAHDLEGVVGKRLDSPYVRGRSPNWVKVLNRAYARR